ncbi:MAG: hypothetical protein ACQEP1_06720, partial [Nanobdellota archaeon]
MDIHTTKPIRELNHSEYLEMISGKGINITTQALDRLSDKQRKIFKEEELINMLGRDNPKKVYLQKNG